MIVSTVVGYAAVTATLEAFSCRRLGMARTWMSGSGFGTRAIERLRAEEVERQRLAEANTAELQQAASVRLATRQAVRGARRRAR